MSFRERMHPAVSNAERELFISLSKANLTQGLTTQEVIVLRATKPDFLWKLKRLAVFLDGEQVHRGKEEKDEEIKSMLEMQGWKVLRFSYKPPLSLKQKMGIVADIREALGVEANMTGA
jgi:very-short-patch-repair endonuclease